MKDDKGLIVAYILDGQGGGRAIGWDEVKSWSPEQGILWIHLNFTKKNAKRWLIEQSGLDQLNTRAMLTEESRPRSVVEEKGLLVFLRGVNLNPGQDPEDMVSVRVWIEKNRIITTRRRHLLSIDDMREMINANTGPKSAADFLVKLTDRLLDRMADFIDGVDDRADDLERLVITEESHLLRPKIAEIRREAIAIRRYLAPQREALYRLQIEEVPLLDSLHRVQMREATDRTIRYIEDLDAARDRAAITQEQLVSQLQEQLDHRMYILSIVAVIFLPLSFVTGLLGINVGGIPGATYKWAFLLVTAMLVGAGVGIILLFKRKKWI